MNVNAKIGLFVCGLILGACNDHPKVITATADDQSAVKPSGVFSHEHAESPINTGVDFNKLPLSDDVHKVTINEVLPTAKYVYLNVSEGDNTFWIATGKKEVTVGDTYYYKGGLLKTNFESKEYNRVFEKVYLVTNLVAEQHGRDASGTLSEDTKPHEKVAIETHAPKQVQKEGSITISELVGNKEKYEGKTVQITGTCTKINAGIMDRNWIHLKDGSKDDFDLVVTSSEFVPEKSTVTMKATVTLNKDFGAGYRYDLILEQGVIVK